MAAARIIIGIDPGLAHTGWGAFLRRVRLRGDSIHDALA